MAKKSVVSKAKKSATKVAKKVTKAASKTAKKVTKTTSKTAKKVTKAAKEPVIAIKSTGDIELLLRQHVGKPCVPCVKKGDKVTVGTLIARPQGLGANIHSSVDGVVSKITNEAIFIKPSKALTTIGHKVSKEISAKKEDLLGRVTEAGVVGMGGAGFPTGVKLSTDLKGGYILVNAAECEPVFVHNMSQILKYPKEIIKGIQYCMKISNASKAIIALKPRHVPQLNSLMEALKGINNIRIHILPYGPSGEERAVVRECLGVLLPVTALPSEAGAHVINVETVLRVYEAIEYGRPCVSKTLTVAGKLKNGRQPMVFMDLPVGMKVRDVLELAGGIDGKYGEIIMGGPFMGKPCKLDDPITKTTGGLIVTEPFKDFKGAKTGILVCACGGDEARLRDVAAKQNMKVVEVQFCKQALDPKGNGVRKCENPGNCPGQAIKCMNIKKAGATDILVANCEDCTNTVMGSAPGLGLTVHHQSDNVFDTFGMENVRKLKHSKYYEGPIPEGCTASTGPNYKIFKTNEVASSVNKDSGVSEDYSKQYVFKEDTPDGELVISIQSGSDISVKYED